MYAHIYNIYSQFLCLITIVPEYIKLFLHYTTGKINLALHFGKLKKMTPVSTLKSQVELIIWKVHIIIPDSHQQSVPWPGWFVAHAILYLPTTKQAKSGLISRSS